jgi:RNA polymerase sigma-70 factor (ECF subfamily)
MDLNSVIKGCNNNQRKAQQQLYQHCFPFLLTLCRRYTTDQDAIISIVNDGMLKVFKHIDQYDTSRPLRSWVSTIVFRSLSDHFKKENAGFTFLLVDELPVTSSSVSTEDLIIYDDLLNVTAHLPPMSKRVFILYAVEGYSHKEVAATLDMSVGTSKWHLSTARKQLRELLSKQYKEYGNG